MNGLVLVRFLRIFLLLYSSIAISQLRPPIQNFSPVNYRGENQNWDISQATSKIIYVANNKGLLEFNGAVWRLYPSPNESIMRSVKVVGDRIYTGCYMEFGYWSKDGLDVLGYTSISQKIDTPLAEDEEFWNILELGNLIVFQSKKRIYIYNVDNNSVSSIDSSNTIPKIIKVGATIYFQRIDEGLFKIEYGKDILVSDDDLVMKEEIINIFKSGDELRILTQNDGFYTLKEGLLNKSDFYANDYLSKVSLYDGIRSRNGDYVLGTISNGVVYFDSQGKLLNQIDQNNGLPNNTTLSIFEDIENNIWLGLDNGISYVNTNAPYKVYNDDKGILGSVYTAEIQKGILYLGTNQGLFYRTLEGTEGFKFVSGTQGQVWNLKDIGGTLFCGHHSGTFIIEEGTAIKVASTPGTWDIATIEGHPELLLQGNYNGLYVLEKKGDLWALRNKIEGFNNSSRYFEVLDNTIFINHEYNGVFSVQVDDSFSKVESFIEDTSLKGANSGMVEHQGEILYAYKKGVFKYDRGGDKFVRDSILSMMFTEENYESGKLIFNEKSNVLWAFTKSGVSYLGYETLTNSPKIRHIPLAKGIRNGILGYENMLDLGNSEFLTGTASGYLTIKLDDIAEEKFQINIDGVAIKDSDNSWKSIDKKTNGSFKSDEGNIKITFYTPEYNCFQITQYQYQLEGMYDSWSDWASSHTTTFENLPYGDYTFKVKSKIGSTFSSNVASYSFKIDKPWYLTNVMMVIYGVGILLFSIFMHNLYKRHYNKQKQKLIEKNRKELDFAQVQSEKEIIRIKNQKLEAEFKGKSKELAASTMSIIKKNELLTKIKKELDPIKDKESVKPVIKIINENLNESNDWELFQEAFNNADSKFFKKIKKVHPELSPNDLKLCAYLRLNLSSKEIAQLLNISPRSVEIKRYRLRKKLNLEHEDNLVNYILGI